MCVFFIIITGLTECDYFTTDEYNYTHFVDLSTIKDAQSSDYYARVPIYVIGPRYGNIILSSSNTPNREKDFVYEIGNVLLAFMVLVCWFDNLFYFFFFFETISIFE